MHGYLQHGKGTQGPFCTEQVAIRNRAWPHAGEWEAKFEGRWRKVHMNLSNLWIVYNGQKITIQIEGV